MLHGILSLLMKTVMNSHKTLSKTTCLLEHKVPFSFKSFKFKLMYQFTVCMCIHCIQNSNEIIQANLLSQMKKAKRIMVIPKMFLLILTYLFLRGVEIQFQCLILHTILVGLCFASRKNNGRP